MLTYDISGLDPALVVVILAAVVIANAVRALYSRKGWRDKAEKSLGLALQLRDHAENGRERKAAQALMDDALQMVESASNRSAARERAVAFVTNRIIMTVQTVPVALITAAMYGVFNWQIVAMALFGPVCDLALYAIEKSARSYYERKYRISKQVEDDAHDDQRDGGDADVLE